MPDETPFHPGELRAQALAGGGAGGAGIRSFMPDQHRTFFATLPLVSLGLRDAAGSPVATVMTGPAGFITSPAPTLLRIAGALPPGDPAAGAIRAGAEVGLLGLEFATRRRNRANGTIVAADAGGFDLAVAQSFGNCPKYIQTRALREAPGEPGAVEALSHLDAEARALIGAADTFLVASGAGGARGGMDVSHRGGRPGFVRIEGDELAIPDFRGNRYYDTLGNFLLDPRAGLLFVDFATGDLLHLSGRVTIDWSPGEGAPQGSERVWRLRLEGAIRRRAALPLRMELRDYAPTSLETGIWSEAEAPRTAFRDLRPTG